MIRGLMKRGGAVSARRPIPTVLRGHGSGSGPAVAGQPSRQLSGWETLSLGRVAARMGAPLESNPYQQASGRFLIWRFGWHLAQWERDPLLRGTVRRKVKRETRRPGRGRALSGRRSEWTAGEHEALLLMADRLHTVELALMLERPERGVSVKLSRLRKAQASGGTA